MFSSKKLPYLFLIILILLSALFGFRAAEKPIFVQLQNMGNNGIPMTDRIENDPVVQFIGKSFDEIKRQLGEPHEQGSSSWLGTHDYILYRSKDGYIRFNSPDSDENSIATSIIIGPGQEVLGAKAGMNFSEIIAILGEPDFGPEPGINNLYYMDYCWGELNDQVPDYLVSFAAEDIDAPTRDIFIKWEGYEYRSTSFQ
jgi:hypothetical protein